jgi:hypothetical protein
VRRGRRGADEWGRGAGRTSLEDLDRDVGVTRERQPQLHLQQESVPARKTSVRVHHSRPTEVAVIRTVQTQLLVPQIQFELNVGFTQQEITTPRMTSRAADRQYLMRKLPLRLLYLQRRAHVIFSKARTCSFTKGN